MNERIDMTDDVIQPTGSDATQKPMAPEARHTTSRLALLIVLFVAVCGLALGMAQYWRGSYVPMPTRYGLQEYSKQQDQTQEITESNFEAEIEATDEEFAAIEAELDAALDEIDAELEAEFDAKP